MFKKLRAVLCPKHSKDQQTAPEKPELETQDDPMSPENVKNDILFEIARVREEEEERKRRKATRAAEEKAHAMGYLKQLYDRFKDVPTGLRIAGRVYPADWQLNSDCLQLLTADGLRQLVVTWHVDRNYCPRENDWCVWFIVTFQSYTGNGNQEWAREHQLNIYETFLKFYVKEWLVVLEEDAEQTQND